VPGNPQLALERPLVLVVDDSATIRQHLRGVLNRGGYEVHCVADGEADYPPRVKLGDAV
jgi:CheY-like chemotaxis protein